MRLTTEEAEEALASMRSNSLYWEAKGVLAECPEGTKLDEEALYWAAWNVQVESMDAAEAANWYLERIGDRYISNSFSLAMLPEGGDLKISEADPGEIWEKPVYPTQRVRPTISCVGHADTAAMFSSLLGRDVPVNRVSITLKRGDTLFVGQYAGPRLPEGTSTLPEGATITWKKVVVK